MSKQARRFVKGTQVEVTAVGPWHGKRGVVISNYRTYNEVFMRLEDGNGLYMSYGNIMPHTPGPDRIEEMFT